MRATEYGLEWELDDDERKGQLGLLRENHYRALFADGQRERSFGPNDVWLDIGANIGAFALRAAPLVHKVIAVEPEPDNVRWLKRNRDLNNQKNVQIREAAIVADHQERVWLALSKTFSSTHRVGSIRGRTNILVDAINIDKIVLDYGVDKIKMDCEGSEAEILEVMDFRPIKEIVFEYHFAFLHDDDWSRFHGILSRIRNAEFQILKEPPRVSKTWHTIVWARR